MKHVFFAIGLYDGQSERRYPANGTICVSNLEKSSQRELLYDGCDLVEPCHDGGGAFVGYTDRPQR